MTVLQNIINYYQASIDRCDEKRCDICDADRETIERLKTYLPAEEQQIRDTWKASKFNTLYREVPAKPFYVWEGKIPPDLETYINQLKQKP